MSKKNTQTVTKKKSRGKTFLKVLGVFLSVLVLFIGVTALISVVGNKANIEKIERFETVEKDDKLIPEKDENGYWTFTTDRALKVVQLTDVHIGGGWMCLKKDLMALNCVAAMLTEEKPDLVIVTGDVSYPVPFQAGTFNNKASARIFATLMEKLGIYWTMTMGNHDTEAYSYFTRDEIGDFYEGEEYSYCLFEKGSEEVDGCGNQVINVKNSKGIITQSLFEFDSHSYTDGDWFGIMWKYDNIHDNQVQWYADTLDKLNAQNNAIYAKENLPQNSNIQSLAFFHIPLVEYRDAWLEYANNNYQDTENVKLIYGGIGESGNLVYHGMHEDILFETMLEKGSTQGVFVGHDHFNNYSLLYKGIRFTYGMSVDYLAYPGIYKIGAQRGCTVITIAPDGSFDCKGESYYQDKYQTVFEKEEVSMQDLYAYDNES